MKRSRVASALFVALLLLLLPQSASAYCSEITFDGGFGGTDIYSATTIAWDSTSSYECSDLEQMTVYGWSPGYEVTSYINTPNSQWIDAWGAGAWYANAVAVVGMSQGGSGYYWTEGQGTEYLCDWYYNCYVDAYYAGPEMVWVPGAIPELDASNYAPVVNSGVVQVWATFPEWANPSNLVWSGCSDGGNGTCYFYPSDSWTANCGSLFQRWRM